MNNINDVFEIVKRKRFLENYTEIKPNSGINHRFVGTGTNAKDKKTDLTDEDKMLIKKGLTALVSDIQKAIKKI